MRDNKKDFTEELSPSVIHEEVKKSLKETDPFVLTKFVWVDDDSSECIIKSLKESQFAHTVDSEIYFFPVNPKYFVTDKDFVFSTSTFELNSEKKKSSKYNFAQLMETPWREIWPELKSNNDYFAHLQVQLLNGRTIRTVLDKATATHLEALGFKIVEQKYKDYFLKMLSINKDIFVNWCKTGETPLIIRKKPGRGLAFNLIINGNLKTFENKKDCWQQEFVNLLNYEAFKKKLQRAKGEFKIGNMICSVP